MPAHLSKTLLVKSSPVWELKLLSTSRLPPPVETLLVKTSSVWELILLSMPSPLVEDSLGDELPGLGADIIMD